MCPGQYLPAPLSVRTTEPEGIVRVYTLLRYFKQNGRAGRGPAELNQGTTVSSASSSVFFRYERLCFSGGILYCPPFKNPCLSLPGNKKGVIGKKGLRTLFCRVFPGSYDNP